MVRPLRRPARMIFAAAVLIVALIGMYARASEPFSAIVEVPIQLGPDSTAIVGELVRGDFALVGIREGDRLRVLEGDTITTSRASTLDRVFIERRLGDTLSVEVEREGKTLALEVEAGRQKILNARRFGMRHVVVERALEALFVGALLAFVVVGIALFIRSRGRGYLASLATALLAAGGMFGAPSISKMNGPGGPLMVAFAFTVVVVAISAIPAVTSALIRFPNGRYGARWTRWMARIAVVGLGLVLSSLILTDLLNLPNRVGGAVALALVVTLIALPPIGLAQKYRRSEDGVVRQQMKWVMLPIGAFASALILSAMSDVVSVFDSSQTATGYLFNVVGSVALSLSLAAIPLGVLAGAMNFRPWDADLWIARSAAVGTATLGLAAVFAGGAEALRLGLRASMGDGAEAVAAALAAAVALAVFNPVREWLTRRADTDLICTRERLTERLPLLLAGRQVVASPEEVGRVALHAIRDVLNTDRAAVIDLDPEGWEVVATVGLEAGAVLEWANRALDASSMPERSVQVWEDPAFVLRVPLRSAEDELVGVLALGTHGKGRGYSTEERKALDTASRSLAEALRVAERREEAEARQYARLSALVDRLGQAGDGSALEVTP